MQTATPPRPLSLDALFKLLKTYDACPGIQRGIWREHYAQCRAARHTFDPADIRDAFDKIFLDFHDMHDKR